MPTVVLQKGHHAPREPGHLTETGAQGEQEVVGVIGDHLRKLLGADPRFTVRVIPGAIPADIKNGAYKVDAFISLHCDGSNDPNRRGWGVGYPSGAVNVKLASLIADEFEKLPHPSARLPDNYTPNMSGYYAWTRVPTDGPEVLVEHDFSSSPAGKAWMLTNAARIAAAEYRAVLRHFNLPPIKEEPMAAVEPWVEPWMRWYIGDRKPATKPKGTPAKIPDEIWPLIKVVEDDRKARPGGEREKALRILIAGALQDVEAARGKLTGA